MYSRTIMDWTLRYDWNDMNHFDRCIALYSHTRYPNLGNHTTSIWQTCNYNNFYWWLSYKADTCMERLGSQATVHRKAVSVLIFSTTFIWNIYHSKKNWARYGQECISVFKWNTCYCYLTLMKPEFSRQIFEKYISNFMKIHPVGAELSCAKRRMHSCGWS
jgi:hypothetical protein